MPRTKRYILKKRKKTRKNIIQRKNKGIKKNIRGGLNTPKKDSPLPRSIHVIKPGDTLKGTSEESTDDPHEGRTNSLDNLTKEELEQFNTSRTVSRRHLSPTEVNSQYANNLQKIFLNFYEETLKFFEKERSELIKAELFFSKKSEYTQAMSAIDGSIENMTNIKDMVIDKNEYTHGDKGNIKKLDSIERWIDAINIVHPCGEIVKNLKGNIFNKDLVPIDKKYKYVLNVPEASRKKKSVKNSPNKLFKIFSKKKTLSPIKWNPEDISMGWAKDENGNITISEKDRLRIEEKRNEYAKEHKGEIPITAKKAALLLNIIK